MISPNYFSLIYLQSTQYVHTEPAICNFLNYPRPCFSLGLILEGTGEFITEDGAAVSVSVGDIIFIPVASQYISKWSGKPNSRFITIHFSFAAGQGISEKENFRLQKVLLPDAEKKQG